MTVALVPRAAGAQAVCPAPSYASGPLHHSLLAMTEVDHNGYRHTICPPGRVPVDLESVIHIEPDLSALVGRFDHLGVSTPDLASLTAQSDRVGGLLRTYLDSLGPYLAAVNLAQAELARQPSNHIARTRANAALASLGKLNGRVIDELTTLDKQGTESALGKLEAYLSLEKLLGEHVEYLYDRLAVVARQALDAARAYHIQMYAIRRSPGRAPVQVHLDGYDNLPAGDPHPIDRLSSHVSDAGRTATEQLQRLNGLYRDAPGAVRSASATLNQQIESAVAATKTLRTWFDSLPRTTEVDSVLGKLPTDQHFSPLKTAMTTFRDSLPAAAALRDKIVALADAAPQVNDGETQRNALTDGVVRMTNRFDQIDSTATKAIQHLAGAARSLAAVEKSIPPNDATITTITRWTVIALRIDSSYTAIRKDVNLLKQLAISMGLVQEFATPPPSASHLDLSLRNLALSAVRPTTLDLTTVDNRDGDYITVSYQVLDSTSATILQSTEETFQVRTFGAFGRWSAALAFTRLNRDDGFRAGAGASYLIHFRYRPDDKTGKTTRWRSFWNGLDPAVGLSSVVVSGDENVEFGFGPTLSVLGDLVQTGAGYNLQQQHWYLMLSTSLLDVIQQISGDGKAKTSADPAS